MTGARADDVRALRTAAAACATGQRALLAVSGADHRDWLERIASNPVKDLAAGHFARVTLMDGKGRMRADVRVLAAPGVDGLLLDVPASHTLALARLLDMYVIQDDVTITDRSEEFSIVTLAGPKAVDVAATVGLPAVSDDEVAALPEGGWTLPSDLTGLPGLDLVVPAATTGAWLERLAAAGAVTAEPAAFDVVRLAQGVPWFAADLVDNVIPLEAHLDAWVSITKGCYPGQEVVARIQNLGSVARKLVRLQAAGNVDLLPGELHGTGEAADKTAGVLTSCAYDPVDDVTLGLGFVRRAFWKPDTRVRSGEIELDVSALGD